MVAVNVKQDNPFLSKETLPGILLIAAAFLAILIANTPLKSYYEQFLSVTLTIKFNNFGLAKPLLLWINDGLMAVFFFLIGLELKYEFLEGVLSDIRQIVLPGFAAIGGMVVPALIYVWFNHQDPVAIRGWAIPAATDIAFALGILALLGNRVPKELKIMLTSIAIFDDVGAILIIALFYTASLSVAALGFAACCIVVLWILNRCGFVKVWPYIFVGALMWLAMIKSGVHATLAGILLAFFIPMKSPKEPGYSPLKHLEHELYGPVSLIILPLFAFANAGVSLLDTGPEAILHHVSLGIFLGLLVGKQVGVFGFSWIALKLKLAKLPRNITYLRLYGLSILTGIGFTMSLFIGTLAFEKVTMDLLFDERIGVISGSIISAVLGYFVLKHALKR